MSLGTTFGVFAGHLSRRCRGTRASLRFLPLAGWHEGSGCGVHRAPAPSRSPLLPVLKMATPLLSPRQQCGHGHGTGVWVPLVGRAQSGALTPRGSREGSVHLVVPLPSSWHPVSQHGQLGTLPSPCTATPFRRTSPFPAESPSREEDVSSAPWEGTVGADTE